MAIRNLSNYYDYYSSNTARNYPGYDVNYRGFIVKQNYDEPTVALCYIANNRAIVRAEMSVPKNGIIGITTGNIVKFVAYGSVKILLFEIEIPSEQGNYQTHYIHDRYAVFANQPENPSSQSKINKLISNNIAIYENNLLCARILSEVITDASFKDKLSYLQKGLSIRDKHFDQTLFTVGGLRSALNSISVFSNYASKLISIAGSEFDTPNLMTEYRTMPTQSDNYTEGRNPASIILDHLFNGDYLQSEIDVRTSVDMLLQIAHLDITAIQHMREELKNHIDWYTLNKKLGYTAPDYPTVSNVIQPTYENKSGSITVVPQSGCQYSIDGRYYQNSNIFGNIAPGNYTIYVRRINDVQMVEKSNGTVTINPIPETPKPPVITPPVTPKPEEKPEEKKSGINWLLIGGSALGIIKLFFK